MKRNRLNEVLIEWNNSPSGLNFMDSESNPLEIINIGNIKNAISDWVVKLESESDEKVVIKYPGNVLDKSEPNKIYFDFSNKESISLYIVLEQDYLKKNVDSYFIRGSIISDAKRYWKDLPSESKKEFYSKLINDQEDTVKYKYLQIFITEHSSKQVYMVSVFNLEGIPEASRKAFGFKLDEDFFTSLLDLCNVTDSDSSPTNRTISGGTYNKGAENSYLNQWQNNILIFRYTMMPAHLIGSDHFKNPKASIKNSFYVAADIKTITISSIDKLLYSLKTGKTKIEIYKHPLFNNSGSREKYYRQHSSSLKVYISGNIESLTSIETDNSVSVLNLQNLSVSDPGRLEIPVIQPDNNYNASLSKFNNVVLPKSGVEKVLVILNVLAYIDIYNNMFNNTRFNKTVSGTGEISPCIVVRLGRLEDILNGKYLPEVLFKNIFRSILRNFRYTKGSEIKLLIETDSNCNKDEYIEILESYLNESLDIFISKLLNFKDPQKIDIIER